MQKKVLKNIRQYHTCWFRDEFYHHLLAAYSFFGVPAEYVVCNYIIDVEPYELGKDIVYSEHEILTDGEFRALTGARPRSLRPDDFVEAYYHLYPFGVSFDYRTGRVLSAFPQKTVQ